MYGMKAMIGSLLLIGMIAVAIALIRKNKLISFGIFWFLITMSVESSIIPITDIMMEHRMYLPMFGIGMIVAGLIMRYVPLKSSYLVYIAFAILFMLLATATYNRNKVWQSELSLWQDCLEKDPENPRAMVNLGRAYKNRAMHAGNKQQRTNDLRTAISYFSMSMTGDTIFSQAYTNRGLAYLELDEYDKALADIRLVSSKKRRYEFMKLHIEGVIYAKKGLLDQAMDNFNRAIELEDGYYQLYTWRGLVAAELKEYRQAISDFKRSLELAPSQTILYINISNMYYLTGDYQQALLWIRKAQLADELIDIRYLRMLEEMDRKNKAAGN